MMTPKFERERARALVEAFQVVEEGPALVQRVRAQHEEILERRRGQDRRDLRWIAVPSDLLGAIINRLDGPTSTARHMGVVTMTIQRWLDRGRIPSWALRRFRELIIAGAPSKRKPNRGRDRHYVERLR